MKTFRDYTISVTDPDLENAIESLRKISLWRFEDPELDRRIAPELSAAGKLSSKLRTRIQYEQLGGSPFLFNYCPGCGGQNRTVFRDEEDLPEGVCEETSDSDKRSLSDSIWWCHRDQGNRPPEKILRCSHCVADSNSLHGETYVKILPYWGDYEGLAPVVVPKSSLELSGVERIHLLFQSRNIECCVVFPGRVAYSHQVSKRYSILDYPVTEKSSGDAALILAQACGDYATTLRVSFEEWARGLGKDCSSSEDEAEYCRRLALRSSLKGLPIQELAELTLYPDVQEKLK